MQELGSLLLSGLGCHQDQTRGFDCILRAAERGSATAMYKYGIVMRSTGKPDIAIDYFKRSDLAGANLELGHMYRNGSGCERNSAQAFQYFLRAAQQGEITAMYEVGRCYRDGVGVEASEEKAAQWMRQAANEKCRPAAKTFAEMLRSGIGVPLDVPLATRYERMCDDPEDYDYEEEDEDEYEYAAPTRLDLTGIQALRSSSTIEADFMDE
jgi:TPR repeat protein